MKRKYNTEQTEEPQLKRINIEQPKPTTTIEELELRIKKLEKYIEKHMINKNELCYSYIS
jgi:hypothetical protein